MFEYGNPEAILALLQVAPNELGHTPSDDFEHFCSVTGCPRDNAWAKLAMVWSKTSSRD
ncbi:hypothetical protein [Paraburkholderia caribensis]|uniref:hypothetical protein n=1 Tax=Paraburkholderia caribensis TaxID=75105 RepID=UPI00285F7D4C|nr:hypothetical protein [Paraburkholderia caribensis]MDR6381854.1 hypothetical protein [Paraburkholderia caribensis]